VHGLCCCHSNMIMFKHCIVVNSYKSDGKFSCQENQSISCLELIGMIERSTNNPSPTSVVLEFSGT